MTYIDNAKTLVDGQMLSTGNPVELVKTVATKCRSISESETEKCALLLEFAVMALMLQGNHQRSEEPSRSSH